MADAHPTSDSSTPDLGPPGSGSNPHIAADPDMRYNAIGEPYFPDDPDPDMLSDEQLLEGIGEQIEANMAHLPRAPPIAWQIPKELYRKASTQQDQLTDDERQLLLSRGDVFGKALAYPDSLTPEEHNIVLGWGPPDAVRAGIERASGGTLHTPAELYAKARRIQRGEEPGALSDEEVGMILMYFPADIDKAVIFFGLPYKRDTPGDDEARGLLLGRSGGADAAMPMYILALWEGGAKDRLARRVLLAEQTKHQSGAPSFLSPDQLAQKLQFQTPVPRNSVLSDRLAAMLANPPGEPSAMSHPAPLSEQQARLTMLQLQVIERAKLPRGDLGEDLQVDQISRTLAELQRSREKGELSQEMFLEQNWKNIQALRSYVDKKRSERFLRLGLSDPARRAQLDTPQARAAGWGLGPQPPDSPGTAEASKSVYPLEPFIIPNDRWERGSKGKLKWPYTVYGRESTPMACFSDDLQEEMKAKGIVVDCYPTYLNERFSQLTPEQNASYAARSEAARIKAWDEYDREMARQAAVRADLREK